MNLAEFGLVAMTFKSKEFYLVKPFKFEERPGGVKRRGSGIS